MKKLGKIIWHHARDDFHAGLYGTLLLFLTVGVVLNFSLQIENNFIDAPAFRYVRILLCFVLYSFGYFFTCWLVGRFRQELTFWSSKRFWLLSITGLAILSVDKGFPYTYILIRYFSNHYGLYVWLHQLVDHASTFVWVLLPLFFVYRWLDRQRSDFYGLTSSSSIKAYWSLLAVMIPLIALATTNRGFITYYPMYKSSGVEILYHWATWVPAATYEFFYGLSFINVELLFRGFFVIGMSQVLGKNAILPMITIYCFLHFGKPLGECVSSIVGGYALGILAFHTRSIWGGIVVHMGIAWMMELAAYAVKHATNS